MIDFSLQVSYYRLYIILTSILAPTIRCCTGSRFLLLSLSRNVYSLRRPAHGTSISVLFSVLLSSLKGCFVRLQLFSWMSLSCHINLPKILRTVFHSRSLYWILWLIPRQCVQRFLSRFPDRKYTPEPGAAGSDRFALESRSLWLWHRHNIHKPYPSCLWYSHPHILSLAWTPI